MKLLVTSIYSSKVIYWNYFSVICTLSNTCITILSAMHMKELILNYLNGLIHWFELYRISFGFQNHFDYWEVI